MKRNKRHHPSLPETQIPRKKQPKAKGRHGASVRRLRPAWAKYFQAILEYTAKSCPGSREKVEKEELKKEKGRQTYKE